jgi:hypothetical protein
MRNSIASLVTIMLTTFQLYSQNTTGNLAGRILGPLDEPIPAVNVVCTSPELIGLRGSTSDSTGRFHVEYLPPGLYSIKISRVSYQVVEIRKVSILLGRTTSLGNLHLEERMVVAGEIAVTGARSVLDLTSSMVGGTVVAEEISALPLERNYQAMSLLLPHSTVSQYTGALVYGNPGTGSMSSYPKFERKYAALEASMEKSSSEGPNFMASNVLSRNEGNYAGFANTDAFLQMTPDEIETSGAREQSAVQTRTPQQGDCSASWRIGRHICDGLQSTESPGRVLAGAFY